MIAHIAIFAGIRPGEILALQRRHIALDCRTVEIDQRLYRGRIDGPKTDSSSREAAIPPNTAALLMEWMECVGPQPDAWVFASENRSKPLLRDNVWYRRMKPRLRKVGMEWANFQVMLRTNASLGHDAGIDPKVCGPTGPRDRGLDRRVHPQRNGRTGGSSSKELANNTNPEAALKKRTAPVVSVLLVLGTEISMLANLLRHSNRDVQTASGFGEAAARLQSSAPAVGRCSVPV